MGAADQQAGRVVVLSDNPETLDGLTTYLEGAGMASRSTRDLREGAKLAQSNARALVVFPDDFKHDEVRELLRKVVTLPLLVLVVTSEPGRFRGDRAPRSEDAPQVLPKPAFGWEILDTIRAHQRDGEA